MAMRFELPGVVPPTGPDGTVEWARPGAGVLGGLAARLGSDPRGYELLLAVVAALRGALPGDTWEAMVEELPFPARAALRAPGRPPATPPGSLAELVERVAAAVLQPHARAGLEVGAVFASLKAALPRGLVDAVAEELPPELAAAWRAAR